MPSVSGSLLWLGEGAPTGTLSVYLCLLLLYLYPMSLHFLDSSHRNIFRLCNVPVFQLFLFGFQTVCPWPVAGLPGRGALYLAAVPIFVGRWFGRGGDPAGW